jgi:hypothetical protein
MKKTSIHLMLIIIFSAVLLGACKKDKDEEIEPTKENLAGNYKLTGLTTSTPSSGEVNTYNQIEACERDDIYTLNTDFSAAYTDAGTECEPPGSYESTWSFDENKNITINGSSFDYEGTVKSFNGKTLVVEGTYNMGITYTIKATFTKQ